MATSILMVCGVLLSGSDRAAADSPAAPELSAVLAFGLKYPVDRWLPVRCEVVNPTDRTISGRIVIPGSDGACPVTLSTPITCPPRSRARASTYFYFVPDASKDAAREATDSSSPIAAAELRSDQGALLARCPVSGQPASAADLEAGGGLSTLLLALAAETHDTDDQSIDISSFAQFLGNLSGASVVPVVVDASRFPLDATGLQGAAFLVADLRAIESLSIAKRASLIEYLQRGGVLIVTPSNTAIDPATTWLAKWLPFSIIGERSIDAVPATSNATNQIKFRECVPVVDAVLTRGEPVLADEQLVYACFARVGVGRIAFAAFPLNAIDPADKQAASTFRELLGLNQRSVMWADAEFPKQRDQILQSMIGTPATSWRAALILVACYIGVVGGLYLALRGPSRPIALCLSLVVASLVSLGLVVFTAASNRAAGGSLTCARIATIDVTQDGYLRQEATAYLGTARELSISTAAGATLCATRGKEVDPPVLMFPPFSSPAVALHTNRIKCVWQSASFSETPKPLVSCTGQFDAKGLLLSIQNNLGQTVQSPLLIWGTVRFKLGDIRPGSTRLRLGERNDSDDFSNASVVTTDLSRLRGSVLRAVSMSRRRSDDLAMQCPKLVGWLEREQDQLICCSEPPGTTQVQVAVRTDVSVQPTSAGVDVHIDDALVRFQPASGLPYDRQRGQWIQTAQTGQWLVAFTTPAELGRIKPARLTLSMDAHCPVHRLILRKGQCINGAVRQQNDGPVVVRWDGESGRKKVTIECTDTDVDAYGLVWLLVSAEALEPKSGDASASLWQIVSMSGALDGRAH